MNKAMTIARRELGSYFDSPIAYIFVASFIVACGVFFFFVSGFFAGNEASLRGFFQLMPALLSVLVPALTMRAWAEEKRQGTYEFLLTMPYTEAQLVFGKYVAVMGVVGVSLALTLPVPLLVSGFGRFDAGQILGEYLGVAFLASACAALGQYLSSRSRNQISAFIVTSVVLICLNLLGQLPVWINLPLGVARAVNYVSLNYHFLSFVRGVLDTRDMLYFAVLTVAFLYLTVKDIAFGKWR